MKYLFFLCVETYDPPCRTLMRGAKPEVTRFKVLQPDMNKRRLIIFHLIDLLIMQMYVQATFREAWFDWIIDVDKCSSCSGLRQIIRMKEAKGVGFGLQRSCYVSPTAPLVKYAFKYVLAPLAQYVSTHGGSILVSNLKRGGAWKTGVHFNVQSKLE